MSDLVAVTRAELAKLVLKVPEHKVRVAQVGAERAAARSRA